MAPDLAELARFESRPLYLRLADGDRIDRLDDQIETPDPSRWPDYAEHLAAARQVTGSQHAVTTGMARVAGQRCILVGFNFEFLGGSVGVAEGARIARAFSVAVIERVPIVTVAATGGSRMQEGTSSLVQMQVIAAAIAGARRAGVPHVAVASDPTTGGVWWSLVASADLLIGVPGARVSFSGSRTRPAGAGFRTATRLISLADRLGLPVLALIDTPGAAAAPADEAAGRLTPDDLLARGIVRGVIRAGGDSRSC